jgi:hypothetical protein
LFNQIHYACTTLLSVEARMAMKILSYEEAKLWIRAGDVIAFGGSSHFSGIIKMAISAELSHVGIILEIQAKDSESGEFCHQIIDATSRQGVKISRFSDRVDEYDGDVWWLPLRQDIRQVTFDQCAFYEFLCAQVGKKYDRLQAVGSAIDVFDALPPGMCRPGYNEENFDRFFCSELVAAGLKAAGIVPASINASEVTPIDLCRWNIYAPEYYLLKGEPKEISGYNSCDPGNN